mmetsp:Transcript_10653/g.27660  ORF Transcript_10653/g.27660 Transcript_10653/m.27660 type:complete len:215 (-) Transcript_10653:848-1492(-)
MSASTSIAPPYRCSSILRNTAGRTSRTFTMRLAIAPLPPSLPLPPLCVSLRCRASLHCPSAICEHSIARSVSHRALRMFECAWMRSSPTTKVTSADASSSSSEEICTSASWLSASRCATSRPGIGVKGPQRTNAPLAPAWLPSPDARPPCELRSVSTTACSQNSSSRPIGSHHALRRPSIMLSLLDGSSSSVMNRNESNHVVHRSRLPSAHAPM